MDILKAIQEKIQILPESIDKNRFNSIINHINQAERHLNRGKELNDEDLFNDVVYRTNQAFEGILKESFSIFTGKNTTHRKLVDIEKYFNENETFHQRIMELFKNYRERWRNISTHDYNLLFSEEEAFLAILTISSFIYILLSQIIEKLSYDKEEPKIRKEASAILRTIPNYDSLSLFEQIKKLLIAFDIFFAPKYFINEATLLGGITAYLTSIDKTINFQREVKIGNKNYFADLIIANDDDKLIIEVKKYFSLQSMSNRIQQLTSYLIASSITNGILFFPREKGVDPIVDEQIIEIEDKKVRIAIIH